MLRHCIIHCLKVKAKTAVFGFHTRFVQTARTQVVLRRRALPVVGGKIPLGNVFGLRVAVPRFCVVGVDGGRDRDFCCAHVINGEIFFVKRKRWRLSNGADSGFNTDRLHPINGHFL